MGIRYIPVWLMQSPNPRIFHTSRVGVLIGLRARGAVKYVTIATEFVTWPFVGQEIHFTTLLIDSVVCRMTLFITW